MNAPLAALVAAPVCFVFFFKVWFCELSILFCLVFGATIIFFPFFSITLDVFISLVMIFLSFLFVLAILTCLSTIAGLLDFTIQLKVLNYCFLLEVGSVFRIDSLSPIFVPPSSKFSSGDSFIGVKNLSPSPNGELGVDFILKGL